MRKLFTLLVLSTILLVGAAFAIPFFIPADVYKNRVIAAVENATHRTLSVDGDIKIQFRPSVEFVIEEASFSNAQGATDPVMASMERLTIGVSWRALFKRQLVIEKIVLERPVISLEILKDATANWEFDPAPQTTDIESAIAEEPAESDIKGTSSYAISFGDMRLIDGAVTYRNALTGARYDVSGIDAKIELPDLRGPFKLTGNIIYEDEEMNIDLFLGSLQAIARDQQTPFALSLSSRLIKAELDGTLTGGKAAKIKAAAKVEVPSVRALAAWAGKPVAIEEGFEAFTITGNLYSSGSLYSFTDAEVSFDGMKGTGSLTIKNSGAKPVISGRLDVDRIDIRPYMKADAQTTGGGDKEELAWDDTALDFSGLKSINVSFALKSRAFYFQDYEIGEADLSLKIRNNKLTAKLNKLDLYKGTASGSMSLDANQKVARVAAEFVFTGIDSAPLIKAATDKELIEGLGDFNFTVTTVGASQKDLMKGLEGSGALKLRDGKLLGADLNRMLQIASAFAPGQAPAAQEAGETGETATATEAGSGKATDFVEMGGTFTIAKGILTTKDFLLVNEVLSLAGSGKIDLGRQKINMRLTPGKRQDDGGTRVAMKVKGPWNNIKYLPDFESALKGIIFDALAGGRDKNSDTETEETTDGDLVIDLLGTFFGKGK